MSLIKSISTVTYYNSSSCFKRKTLSYKEKIFILLNPFASSFSRKGLVIYYSQATADRSLHLHTNFTNILQPRQNIIDIEGKKVTNKRQRINICHSCSTTLFLHYQFRCILFLSMYQNFTYMFGQSFSLLEPHIRQGGI